MTAIIIYDNNTPPVELTDLDDDQAHRLFGLHADKRGGTITFLKEDEWISIDLSGAKAVIIKTGKQIQGGQA